MTSKRSLNIQGKTLSMVVLLILAVGVMSTQIGCGKSSNLDYVVVSGNVTWQGKPLPKGMIRFIPIAPTKGPTSAAEIVQGRYEVTSRGGVPVGEHRVEITSGQDSGQAQQMGGPADVGNIQAFQLIPPIYNRQSKLKANIEAETKKMTLDYDLQ